MCDGDCFGCAECAEERSALIDGLLRAVDSGRISESALLDVIMRNTDRPEIVALASDLKIRSEGV